MTSSLYDILEVNQAASQEAITASYKRLYAKYSEKAGVQNEDATNLLIALKESYQTLSDVDRRCRYDQRLASRVEEQYVPEHEHFSFFKLLMIVLIIGVCGVLYSKYQSDQEKARLEREKAIETVRMAEIAAKKENELRQDAERVEFQRRRDEQVERQNRERDLAYGNQVSSELRNAEARQRMERERAEQQRLSAMRQQQNELERQLAKDKAMLRQLEAENNRYRR
jgi:curved DNA-binding protein CbpA